MKGLRVVMVSLLIAAIIFIAGVALGLSVDKYKSDTVSTQTQYNELNLDSYITEQQLLSVFKGDKCAILEKRLSDLSANTRDFGNLLNRVDASKAFPMNFDYLKQKYFISEAKFYATILSLNKECPQKRDSILFFYKVDHLASQKQGFVLDDLDQKYNHNITILSFDIDYQKEPLVSLLMEQYNVTTAPTLVINQNTVSDGYIELSEIEQYLYPQ